MQANPDIQFIWVGGFSFGQITDGYQEYKEIYDHPPENLKLTGIIDRKDMNRYYNIADIFLLPSYSELFPMSILEAFSCGTPVLLRDLELYVSILSDCYIKASDVNAMDKLVKEYAKAPEKLLTYQKKSHEAANYYSEENVMSLWKNYYLSLLPVRLTKHAS